MNPQLKLLPPSKPRLGLYLRPGRNDHTVFEQLLAEDRAVSGLVLDARHEARHRRLRETLLGNGVHAVLDPNLMELSTPGGSVLSGLSELPWAEFATASATDLKGAKGRALAAQVAAFVEAHGFSAVLAPTHFLMSAQDEMFAADRLVATQLRNELDRRSLRGTTVFYPLAMAASTLVDPVRRAILTAGLGSIDIDAVWLRLHPFGATSAGPIALRRYLETGWALARLGLPVVGERTGTIGLAMMAFGALGGVESGITFGERFDAAPLLRPRPPDGDPFSPAPRVYLHELGAFVTRAVARELFENRSMIAATGCRDASCCRSGVSDMIRNPRRHFVVQRTREVDSLGAIAPAARANVYLREVLQPRALAALRAARIVPQLEPAQRRLEAWNLTLSAVESGTTPVPVPALGARLGSQRPKPQALS